MRFSRVGDGLAAIKSLDAIAADEHLRDAVSPEGNAADGQFARVASDRLLAARVAADDQGAAIDDRQDACRGQARGKDEHTTSPRASKLATTVVFATRMADSPKSGSHRPASSARTCGRTASDLVQRRARFDPATSSSSS